MTTHETDNQISVYGSIDNFKADMFKKQMKAVKNFLGSEENALKFFTMASYVLQKTPKALECSRESIITAFLTAASLKMYPSQVSKKCCFIPYIGKKKELKFQLQYEGLTDLAYNAGMKDIHTDIVYEKDQMEIKDRRIKHTYDFFIGRDQRGKPRGVYAEGITPTGGYIYEIMGERDVMKIKNLSKAKNKADSPWNDTAKDPFLWMWRKTALIQMLKLAPKNEMLERAIAVENQESIINQGKEEFDLTGPATGKANHKPDQAKKVDVKIEDNDRFNEAE